MPSLQTTNMRENPEVESMR